MKRYAFLINIKKTKFNLYKNLHSHPWQEVLDVLRNHNIRNYSIFYRDETLFSYYEYYGTDHAKDISMIAANDTTQEWWSITKTCQKPINLAKKNEWWSPMLEFFHTK